MRIRDLLYETWQALTANKGRSLLTILGIVIGISAVITMTSLIGGIKNSLISTLGLNQSRAIYISVSSSYPIKTSDLDLIKSQVTGYEYVTGTVSGSVAAKSDTKSASTTVIGAEPSYFEASGVKLTKGRVFTSDEASSAAMVVVVDQNVVKGLFGDANEDVVGKVVRLGSDSYTIVGVAESQAMMGMRFSQVYLPFKTAVARVVGSGATIGEVIGYAKEGVDVDDLSTRTKDYLVSYLKIPDSQTDSAVYVQSMQSVISQLNTMMGAFQLIMGAVASISLLVGGIGIMNMMLTNVTERIREIGLRKALGARSRDITRQFLLEAIGLCMTGGVIGIVLGYLMSWGLAGIVGALGLTKGLSSITPDMSPTSAITAVVISVGIGVAFGYYPAKRAARLNPVDSLHYQ